MKTRKLLFCLAIGLLDQFSLWNARACGLMDPRVEPRHVVEGASFIFQDSSEDFQGAAGEAEFFRRVAELELIRLKTGYADFYRSASYKLGALDIALSPDLENAVSDLPVVPCQADHCLGRSGVDLTRPTGIEELDSLARRIGGRGLFLRKSRAFLTFDKIWLNHRALIASVPKEYSSVASAKLVSYSCITIPQLVRWAGPSSYDYSHYSSANFERFFAVNPETKTFQKKLHPMVPASYRTTSGETFARFTDGTGNHFWKDPNGLLLWSVARFGYGTHADARQICAQNDARLPTAEEFRRLLASCEDVRKDLGAMFPAQRRNSLPWSSTLDPTDPTRAIVLSDYGLTTLDLDRRSAIHCVRDLN